MKWILTSAEDVINLENICHIWVQECPNGYFLMGEMMHNGEEVCISSIYDNRDKCKRLMYDLYEINESYDLKELNEYKEGMERFICKYCKVEQDIQLVKNNVCICANEKCKSNK